MPLVTCISHKTLGICDPGSPCCSHIRVGTNEEGTPLAEAGGMDLHLVGHTGPCNCPHGGTFESIQGSQLFEVEGRPVTLVGHTTVCQGCKMEGEHNSGTELVEVDA